MVTYYQPEKLSYKEINFVYHIKQKSSDIYDTLFDSVAREVRQHFSEKRIQTGTLGAVIPQ